MKMLYFFVVSVFSALLVSVHSFVSTPFSLISKNTRLFADVEVIFPNGKKFKGAAGTPLKEAAKKAGFSPNYGCEEGMSFLLFTLSVFRKVILFLIIFDFLCTQANVDPAN